MTDPIAELPEIRRRTRRALISSVLPAGMGTSASFAATSLVAEDITGSDTLATFAASMISIGGAITAVPLGRYMAEHGRRPGLLRAWVIGALGAFFAFLAVVTEVYPLLLIGVLGIGTGQAANLAARYAAADLAEETNRAREIGIVVWAGSIGSVLGPTVALGGTGWIAADLLGLDELAGPFIMAIVVFATAGVVVDRQLRPDPLLRSQQLDVAGAEQRERPSLAESFRKLVTHRLAAIAVFAMAVGQGVMVAVMTVTPLHMDEGAHETRVIGLVISFHIVGMYFFSPLVGWLVDRLPVVLMVGAAGVILPRCRDGLSHRSGGQPRRVRRSVARRYRLVVRHDLRQCTAHLGVLGIGTRRCRRGRLHDGRQRRNRWAAFRRDRRGQQLSRTQPLGGRACALARRRCAVPGGHHDQTANRCDLTARLTEGDQ